jgi:hypothetical protein
MHANRVRLNQKFTQIIVILYNAGGIHQQINLDLASSLSIKIIVMMVRLSLTDLHPIP